MNKGHRIRPFNKVTFWLLLTLTIGLLAGCGKKKISPPSSEITSISQVSKETLYIFEAASDESKTVYLKNAETGADAEFKYNSASDIKSQKGESIVAGQLQCGELVKVAYNLKTKELAYMHSAEDAWSYDALGSILSLNTKQEALYLANNAYKYNAALTCYSNGQRIDFDAIVEKDKITVRGLGKYAYSVTVTEGHGKVKLLNPGDYLGGWLEIGKNITTISRNTILDIPDGKYTLKMTRRGYSLSKEIEVSRDEVLLVDVSELEEKKVDTCLINFDISPIDAEAVIYIGNSKIEGMGPVELTYGKYYLIVKAEGYTTYGGTIVAGSPTATISIQLEGASALKPQGTSSAGTTGSNSSGSTNASSGGSQTSVESPSVTNSSQRQSILQSIQDAQTNLQNSLIGMLN